MAPVNKLTRLEERERLEQAIAALESKRPLLGDEVVAVALASMHEKLTRLDDEVRT